MSASVEQIANDLEEIASSKTRLPTPQQLFQLGTLLYRIPPPSSASSDDTSELLSAYRELTTTIPRPYLSQIFLLYKRGLDALLVSGDTGDLQNASKSLLGLLCHSPLLCQTAYSIDWISTLASLYDRFILNDVPKQQKDDVLSLISSLLLDGFFSSSKTKNMEEGIMGALQAMDEESTDCLRDLQEWQSRVGPSQRSLEQSIKNLTWDEDTMHQRDYIFNMLESSRLLLKDKKTNYVDTNATKKKPPSKASKSVSAADELERRIEQVKQIIPDLGEGFIETALSMFQGNVELTLSTLLNDPSQYPPTLQFLDRSLPRRRKFRSQDEVQESAEARALVKERMALEEQQEQDRYKALLYVSAQQQHEEMVNEYDDDYDDQYDEIDIKLGNADNGFEHDFEQIKLFNKVAREDEAEDSFWQANRNTNRQANNNNNNNGNGEKQYRGQDKIKGGRIIGPDGKVVKKPGGAKKKNNNNRQQQSGPQQEQNNKNNKKNGPQSNNNNNKQPANNNNNQKGGKPRTKPKSNNRVNRQRDKKQKAQGAFGV